MSLTERIPAIARDRRFLALWAAHSISTMGDALTTLTLILLITEKTRSVAAVGGLTIAIAVPGIVIGLLSGAFVDRGNRRRIMITSDRLRALLLIVLAIVALGSPPLVVLYVLAFGQAVVGTFFEPARAALMQVIVPAEDQVRANSLVQTTTVVGELLGATLAGVLVATLHTYWISFAVDAGTFAVSALLIATITVSARAEQDQQHDSPMDAIRDGLRAVRSSPALRALLLVFGALTFALSPMTVLLTPYIVDVLHISSGWIGLIQGGDTVGNVLGGLVLAAVARRVRAKSMITAGMATLAALLAAMTLTTTVPTLLLAYFVFGFLTVAIQVGIGALTQTMVDNAMMGRFMGLMSIVPGIVSVLSMAFAGTLGAALGVRTVFVLGGVVLACCSALAWLQFRRADRTVQPAPA